MRILLVDNYDSFTYNLLHYLEAEGGVVDVVRNDEVSVLELTQYCCVVLSPGPGLPKESGQLMGFIDSVVREKPVLGVCLGMQALAEYFGAQLYNLEKVRHGVAVDCTLDTNAKLFQGLQTETTVGLYHSWAVAEPLPKEFRVTARNSYGVVMAMEHLNLPIHAVQFHPESVLTTHGKEMIRNFLKTLV